MRDSDASSVTGTFDRRPRIKKPLGFGAAFWIELAGLDLATSWVRCGAGAE